MYFRIIHRRVRIHGLITNDLLSHIQITNTYLFLHTPNIIKILQDISTNISNCAFTDYLTDYLKKCIYTFPGRCKKDITPQCS